MVGLTILTAGIGSGVSAFLGAGLLSSVIGGAVGGAISGAIFGGGMYMIKEGVSNGYGNLQLYDVLMAASNGLIVGAATGALFGALNYGIGKAIQSITKKYNLPTGRNGALFSKGDYRFFSPNKVDSKNMGATLIKNVKSGWHLDIDVVSQLHLHGSVGGIAFEHFGISNLINGLLGGIYALSY